MKRLWLLLFVESSAWAIDDLVSTRALGMGEALRAGGNGAAALYLNPAGMASVQQYTLELNYQQGLVDSRQMLGVSIVDSLTSPLAAGAYYGFAMSEPSVGGTSVDASAHEVGLGLAYAFGDLVLLGVTPLKYVNQNGAAPDGTPVESDQFTADAGVVVRPVSGLSLGAGLANLIKDPPLLRRQLGFGASYGFGETLLLEFDTRLDFDRREEISPRYSTGAELFFASAFALRAGAIHESQEDATYVTGGIGYITKVAGVETSARQQLAAGSETLLSFSLKLFAE